MHLVCFVIRIYHDARSSEYQILKTCCIILTLVLKNVEFHSGLHIF